MKSHRRLLWLVAVITVLSIWMVLPEKFEVTIPFLQNSKRTVGSPDININFGPLKIKRKFTTRLGLDLSGGTHLVMEADMSKIAEKDRKSAFDSAKNIVETRINMYGLTEPVVQESKTGEAYRIIVEIPGVANVEDAVGLIGTTAQLSFREEASESAKVATPSSYLQVWPKESGITGKNLKKSEVIFDQNSGNPQVGLQFDTEGAKMFEELTKRNSGKTVAIFLDNQLLSAPRVNQAITGGNAVIQGSFTVKEAKDLAVLLNAGALPVPLKIVQQRHIGATLGQETIQKSLTAGAIGLMTVAVFMIVNYGFLGLIADSALIVYALIVMSIFKIIPVTLTLAGIAGFILSIGMAVDANILIFERMKEELREGKDFATSLKLGFARAFPSIRDSNISSLITCAILYWFGSGIVRGFAITLAIGISISLFSAITVTRTLIKLMYTH
ncbi:protein-export membrane protein SecD [Candidatus Gottesmanbacteria bacterium RIFCSPLOWO2_02_FULL_42_29]|uniref:Protein translocase subunit SecD n=2 Tax=Candidatus Gottesmaniibacteriota TaxID=1752720 RepID=A0A1F6B980_9BACT|nr:MAG: Preprotein translocase subunit SecD [Candidatus Gottesmanbacteria bacterium GW2011_GWA2_42_18]KKS75977.1 MAG: Preprotein translocase subunit SecD [Candidatus Gottesmanbacteria bacterium GW2011_GWC2_42_8]OGG09962.1 MAG: protein-export membrane protein SecD [Candidatus Gottesmanbacteria bacterium RIFCSPHIGHO2_01_FULL_42_27]OGG19558.1 MAG: protein-export membrane protein SecD [Candidatus Gottesmanbacteria bacterium RIFCSPHIGHO2_12_FULL_43_26]OGG33499.1 MAG: protein-export membrane protein 